MSHHVYTTRGIVLAFRGVREADKTAVILTEDLGLVYGEARGIRKPNSRLSTSLIELSIVLVSLVKGKRQWRVTTVTLIRDTGALLRGRRSALTALYRVSKLLLKLVRGEDKNPDLYKQFEESVLSLIVDDIDAFDWELFAVAQILANLGYLSEDDAPKSLEEAKTRRKRLVPLVNSGIRESGLE